MLPAFLYLLALGSNRRHGRHRRPRAVIGAAVRALAADGMTPLRVSRVIDSAPIGPARRRFANAVVLVRDAADPVALLARTQRIERAFGRRRGRRWGDRVLDIDILWWSGGVVETRALRIPHPELANRAFALATARAIAPGMRDPRSGHTIAQLAHRQRRPRPL